MLCDRVLGNRPDLAEPLRTEFKAGASTAQPLSHPPAAGERERLDHLPIDWQQSHRRAFAAISDAGRHVRVLLPVGTVLRHGDVLADQPDLLLVVRLKPCEVLVATPQSQAQAALLALEWGNLHLPVEVTPTELITLPDGPAEGAAYRHQILCQIAKRRFNPMSISGLSWTIQPTPVIKPGSTVKQPAV